MYSVNTGLLRFSSCGKTEHCWVQFLSGSHLQDWAVALQPRAAVPHQLPRLSRRLYVVACMQQIRRLGIHEREWQLGMSFGCRSWWLISWARTAARTEVSAGIQTRSAWVSPSCRLTLLRFKFGAGPAAPASASASTNCTAWLPRLHFKMQDILTLCL